MNPFAEIYNFIITELKGKYPELGECYMFDDEEDNRYKEYYLKFKNHLSSENLVKLYYTIIEEICEFCNKNGYKDALNHSAILMDRLI
ncbi:MAG: hypothetical protein Q4P18_01165 [Methanobrevibacter sp.]|uniref:hypothetical protein n=1 Tax=Methanobrevibacter sp. TaxID=66852 RepID=UPI0026E0E0B3|nr:hypothetical protein [Methanobrevibacter sp.]MDO5848124.1 hypothetical protein [Methanobrevibacter sp.]